MGEREENTLSQRENFIRKMQEEILTGELEIHQKIPPERDLALQMGVSRTIVNMGIAVLENEGFLEVIPRQGTFVADYKKMATADTLNAIMRLKGDVLNDNDIRAILEIRWALEKLTMKNVFERLEDQDLNRLRRCVEEIRSARSSQEAAELAFSFQRCLLEIGQNEMLTLIISTFRRPCIAMWVRFCDIYGLETLYDHTRKSLAYLEIRDYAGAMAWIEDFSREAMDGKYTLYEQDLLKRRKEEVRNNEKLQSGPDSFIESPS